MIDKLLKLADELDTLELEVEADTICNIITKSAETIQQTGPREKTWSQLLAQIKSQTGAETEEQLRNKIWEAGGEQMWNWFTGRKQDATKVTNVLPSERTKQPAK